MKQQAGKKAPTPASWKPGQSGNPSGRPRTGLAFAERIRERVSPDVVIDLAMAVAADTTLTAERRLAALLPLVDRGYTKPPTDQNLNLSHGNASGVNVADLSSDALRRMLAIAEADKGEQPFTADTQPSEATDAEVKS